jgi:galactose mutarotase-like enzyme
MGAEIIDILSKENGTHYLHAADEVYWKRSAPILFPIVGSLKNGKVTVDGTDYAMTQHGFARDMEFKMIKQPDGNRITFRLEETPATLEKYPYRFALELEYILDHYKITCVWRVINTDDKVIHFQIGGHPAFMCPLDNGKKAKQNDYFLNFDTDKDLKYSLLSSNGLVDKEDNILKNDGGLVKIDEHMFDNDALIFEGGQVNKVELCTPDGMSYISVSFDAPLFGLWSPAGKGAPFVCIEPWYGRADKESFSGDIADRDYDNELGVGETFETSFDIEIGV